MPSVKWFFALNQSARAFANYAAMTQVAVLSARQHTRLEPIFLFDGEPCALTDWMLGHGVRVIHHRSSMYERLAQHARAWDKPQSLTTGAGAYLRLDVPELCESHGIDDRYVLYTDCDVMFRREIIHELLPLRPEFFAAAPQSNPDDPADMNSGVQWMNVPALRQLQGPFREFVSAQLDTLRLTGFDQPALRAFFGTRRNGGPAWDALPLSLNWKPHWGADADAGIVHFHGPKPTSRTALARGTAPSSHMALARDGYYGYCHEWDSFAAGLAPLGGQGPVPPGGSARPAPSLGPSLAPSLAPYPDTAPGFAEATYAAANVDVAQALESGQYTSGYEHYVSAGVWERRSGVSPGIARQVRQQMATLNWPRRFPRLPLAPPAGARDAARLYASLVSADRARGVEPPAADAHALLVLEDPALAHYLGALWRRRVTSARAPWTVGGGAHRWRLPYGDGSFDHVALVFRSGLPANEESWPGMAELARVTRPGGLALALVHVLGATPEAPVRPTAPVARRLWKRWFDVLDVQRLVGGDRRDLVLLRPLPGATPAEPSPLQSGAIT